MCMHQMDQHQLFPKVPQQPIHQLITHLTVPSKTRDIFIKDHGGIQTTMQNVNPASNRAFSRDSVLKVPHHSMFENPKHTLQTITLSTALQQQKSPLRVTLYSPLLLLDQVYSITLPVQNQKLPLSPQNLLTRYIIVLNSPRYQRDLDQVICRHDRIWQGINLSIMINSPFVLILCDLMTETNPDRNVFSLFSSLYSSFSFSSLFKHL